MTDRAATVSVIVLTMGDRPRELDELVASLEAEQPFDGVLVGNGVEPPTYPGWRSFPLAENVGISAGRARGAEFAEGDVLVFVDDDATSVTPGLLAACRDAFEQDSSVGALALRVVVEGTDRSLSEWLPRLRGRRELEPGDVTSFHGAAHAVRASAYDDVGGYPDNFWYAHEETDLAWRILDAGHRIAYRPDLVLTHPLTKPSRHDRHLWFSARNRIWLARRHLPIVLAGIYALTWCTIQFARCRSGREVRSVAAGTWTGIRSDPGGRRPIGWRTVMRMTRAGRPPVI